MESKYSREDKPFYKFCHDNNIGDYVRCGENTSAFHLSLDDLLSVAKLERKQILFDGINGGYIKGLENNPEGGIFIVKPIQNDLFKYCGVVLPGFYISNYYDSSKVRDIFIEIEEDPNNFKNYDPVNFKLPQNCKVIDTGENVVSIIVIANSLVEGEFLSQSIFSSSTVANRLPEILEIETSQADLFGKPRLEL